MLFYAYAYPYVPFWGDDLQHLSDYAGNQAQIRFTMSGWVPTRVLPSYFDAIVGMIAAYILQPLFALTLLGAINISHALLISAGFVVAHFAVYKVALLLCERLYALVASFAFIIGAAFAMKPSVMPLLLPTINYTQNHYSMNIANWYLLPYLCNLMLVGGLMMALIYRIKSAKNIATLSASTNPLLSKNPPPSCIYAESEKFAESSVIFRIFFAYRPLFLSAIFLFAYFCAFSIASASVIGASFAFICLIYCIISRYKENRFFGKFSLKSLFNFLTKFGIFEALCVAILLFSAYAILGEIRSDRADYCEFKGINLAFGVKFMAHQFSKISRLFCVIFILFLLAMSAYFVIKSYFFTQNANSQDTDFKVRRVIFFASLAWIFMLCVAFVAICSKCGATYHLVSGLFLAMLFALGVWFGVCFGVNKIFKFIIPLLLLYALLQNGFNSYDERPRSAYLWHKQWVQRWIDEAKEADSAGLDIVVFKVPSDFRHINEQSWLWDSFSRTLHTYGITKKRLKVRFVADEADKK